MMYREASVRLTVIFFLRNHGSQKQWDDPFKELKEKNLSTKNSTSGKSVLRK